MLLHVECVGAPRDLGFDQGRRCAAWVQEALVRSRERACGLRLGGGPLAGDAALRSRAGRDLQRDLTCRFPHLAERTAGIARGAGIALETLTAALGREAFPEVGAWRTLRPNGAEGAPNGPAVLEAWLDEEATAAAAAFLLRTSRPESGYESLSLTRPWLAGSLFGVNAAGLAAAWAPCGGTRSSERSSGRHSAVRTGETGLVAPPWLLLDACLERLDRVEQALVWCERRCPRSKNGGTVRLVFADASGATGAIEVGPAGPKRCALEEFCQTPNAESIDVVRAREPRERNRLHVSLDARARVLRVDSGKGTRAQLELWVAKDAGD